jgi:hypothetical protein
LHFIHFGICLFIYLFIKFIFFLQIKYFDILIMPGCSLKEAFPEFIKDVNENPE